MDFVVAGGVTSIKELRSANDSADVLPVLRAGGRMTPARVQIPPPAPQNKLLTYWLNVNFILLSHTLS